MRVGAEWKVGLWIFEDAEQKEARNVDNFNFQIQKYLISEMLRINFSRISVIELAYPT